MPIKPITFAQYIQNMKAAMFKYIEEDTVDHNDLNAACADQLRQYNKASVQVKHLHLAAAVEHAVEASQREQQDNTDATRAVFDLVCKEGDIHILCENATQAVDPMAGNSKQEQMLAYIADQVEKQVREFVGPRLDDLLRYNTAEIAQRIMWRVYA